MPLLALTLPIQEGVAGTVKLLLKELLVPLSELSLSRYEVVVGIITGSVCGGSDGNGVVYDGGVVDLGVVSDGVGTDNSGGNGVVWNGGAANGVSGNRAV